MKNAFSLVNCESSNNIGYELSSFQIGNNRFTITSTAWAKQTIILWVVIDTPSPTVQEVGV
jgi:hypothetical protein